MGPSPPQSHSSSACPIPVSQGHPQDSSLEGAPCPVGDLGAAVFRKGLQCSHEVIRLNSVQATSYVIF